MSAAEPTPVNLRDRAAASAVIARCLLEQDGAMPRTSAQRFFGVSPLRADARSWYAGAVGEVHVSRQLEKLGDGWTVLHAVPIGRGDTDVDHLVIGPTGVYAINTKHHADSRVWVGSKSMRVNGQPEPYIRASGSERRKVEQALRDVLGIDIPVRSAIVIVGAKELSIKEQPAEVEVMTDRRIVRWLKARRHTSIDVDAVTAVAVQPSTWHVRGADAAAQADLPAFIGLRREVENARTVRSLWFAGVGLITAAAALAYGWNAISSLLG